MGVYYTYVNYDRRQYFSCGLWGRSDKFSGIGFGSGARVLAILLTDRGTWKGQRIGVSGDESAEFEDIYTSFINVTVEAELVLLDVDGFEWLEERLGKEIGTYSFTRLCEFGLYLKRVDIIDFLNRNYGVGAWQRRYADHVKHNTPVGVDEIIKAANRSVKLLA